MPRQSLLPLRIILCKTNQNSKKESLLFFTTASFVSYHGFEERRGEEKNGRERSGRWKCVAKRKGEGREEVVREGKVDAGYHKKRKEKEEEGD